MTYYKNECACGAIITTEFRDRKVCPDCVEQAAIREARESAIAELPEQVEATTPAELTDQQRNYIMNILMPGDMVWITNTEYNHHLVDGCEFRFRRQESL
jgi:hypothetical protein